MRHWFALTIALGACVTPGLSARQDAFPHAFPREGAVRILSNAWMDAWEVTWPVDSPTPMHRHRFDYLGVELVASQNRLTAPDGQQREIALEEGRLWFLERGTTHAETGLSRDPERHAIIVDLKGPVPSAIENNSGLPSGLTVGTRGPDNDRVSMWHMTWAPARAEPVRFLERPVAVMFTADCSIEWTDRDGTRRTQSYRAGQLELIAAGRSVGIRALNDPAHVVVVEFKR